MTFARRRMVWLLLPWAAFVLFGCRGVYYDAMETVGKHKRHILSDRVEQSRDDQEEAQEQFVSTYDLFKQATGFDGGNLEDYYEDLKSSFDASEARANDVRDRIKSIEQVAGDLFDEWQEEIGMISNANLRRQSETQRRETQRRYERLIQSLERAESKMEPVLVAFRDQVLFLKHNLNAAAIASLEGTTASIRSDVDALIADMTAAIRESESFIASLEG